MRTVTGGASLALLTSCGLLCGLTALHARQAPPAPSAPLDGAVRSEVIEGVLKRLNEEYVFPEVAKKMETAIHDRMKKQEYDTLSEGQAFAEKLTQDLQAVSHDKHLRVRYSARPTPEENPQATPTEAEKQKQREDYLHQGKLMNWGFEKVERLPGNIGYLDFRFFQDPEQAGETLAGAMNFLANTDALIIDMRRNGGGDPAMVAVACSYLFDSEPIHLNDIYWRPDNSTRQYWTLPHISGKRYVGKDVYVLTSKYTFSGAEEFTYNLKTQKRATIIGETTGGGANPGGMERINAHFAVFVPAGRAINPITKTNWEGVGVPPDTAVPSTQALQTAHKMALQKQIDKEKDPDRKEALQKALQTVQKELDEIIKKPS